MKNPSWYEDPPEDPEETAENEQDYADFLYDESRDARDLNWSTPDHAPYNK